VITADLPSSEALAAASSAFTFTLVGIGVLIIGSAVAAATWARSLNGWALGGVSFVLSQTAQVVTLFLFGPLIAAFASAPLQEASRAIILSTAARGVRDERPSTFGFGHGAIDLLTSSLIPTLSAVIILAGIRDGSIFVGLDAEVTDRVNTVAIFLASQTLLTGALLIAQGALMLALHALLTMMVLRAVVRGGGARAVGLGLLLSIAIHTPVAVVRTLFPMATLPVLLGALLVALLAYRQGRGAMVEAVAGQ
jgi:uncharacterized membrane protein YhfC